MSILQQTWFYDSVFNNIDKAINPENETFIDGIIRTCNNFIRQAYTPQLKYVILNSIQLYTDDFFRSRNWEKAWEVRGRYDSFTNSFIPYFISIDDINEIRPIDMQEAQSRIDKFGWRVRQYEQDLHQRLKGFK